MRAFKRGIAIKYTTKMTAVMLGVDTKRCHRPHARGGEGHMWWPSCARHTFVLAAGRVALVVPPRVFPPARGWLSDCALCPRRLCAALRLWQPCPGAPHSRLRDRSRRPATPHRHRRLSPTGPAPAPARVALLTPSSRSSARRWPFLEPPARRCASCVPTRVVHVLSLVLVHRVCCVVLPCIHWR